MCFNPRARVGRDATKRESFSMNPSFQSTRPRGARHVVALGAALGVDVSIHAPAWGATQVHLLQLVDQHVSIHAPAWGAT